MDEVVGGAGLNVTSATGGRRMGKKLVVVSLAGLLLALGAIGVANAVSGRSGRVRIASGSEGPDTAGPRNAATVSSSTTSPAAVVPSSDPADPAIATAFATYEILKMSTEVPLSTTQANAAIASIPAGTSAPNGAVAGVSAEIGWPLVSLSSPPASGSTATIETPSAVVGDKPSIDAATSNATDLLGEQAFSSVTTPANKQNADEWFLGIANDYNAQGFEVVEGGTNVLAYQSISVSGSTAVVNAEIEPWQVMRNWNAGGPHDRIVVNKEVMKANLVLNAGGEWQVDSDSFTFVPGWAP